MSSADSALALPQPDLDHRQLQPGDLPSEVVDAAQTGLSPARPPSACDRRAGARGSTPQCAAVRGRGHGR
ncbi:hypothetical protein FHS38_006918 [Streptomyces netropsis]|uniref:Uncharacterized protein n=1 Tax=Streptomyces netropsis TaxID=55404 RepID=A0A7W7PH97_STRNE|nr:hypothetical protein [Streptomyces netropsis]MBB4890826.1 hypothetical protein [Streptomyces netropsis]